MPSAKFKYLLLCAPVLLSACGPDWEMIRVDNVVPYGNSRTAGSGVAYVRAKMLPPKTVDTTAVTTTTVTKPAVQPEAVKSAEPVFQKKQQK